MSLTMAATMPPPSTGFGSGAKYEANLNVAVTCRDCKEMPPNIVEEFSSGDLVCGSCGLVLGDRIIDTRSEWRTFSNDDQGNDDPSRVGDGPNVLLNGSQLETVISRVDGGSGRARELHRAQNKTTHDKSTKTLLAAYKEIGAFCDSTNLPKSVADSAKHFFKLTDDAKAFKGKPQEAIVAGCIFIACRQNKFPRTFKEIYAMTKVSKKEIGRIFKQLEKFLTAHDQKEKDKIRDRGYEPVESSIYTFKPSTGAGELMQRYCNTLGLSNQTTMICERLAEDANTAGTLAGRSPISTAAACIYMISHLRKEPRTAKEISVVAGVSDGTIRNAYKQLYQDREKLIRPKWLEDSKGDITLLPIA